MGFPMTYTANGDEVCFRITPQKAARLHVMDLESSRTSTSLASPAITLEYLLTKRVVGLSVQAKSGMSWEG